MSTGPPIVSALYENPPCPLGVVPNKFRDPDLFPQESGHLGGGRCPHLRLACYLYGPEEVAEYSTSSESGGVRARVIGYAQAHSLIA